MPSRNSWLALLMIHGLVAAPLAAFCFPLQARAAEKSGRLELSTYFKMQFVSDPQIDPAGQRIVYTRHAFDDPETEYEQSSVWLVGASGGPVTRLDEGHHARWSPNGQSILFLRSDKNGQEQLFIREMGTGATRQLTHGPFAPRLPRWSPDGSSIAFLRATPRSDTFDVDDRLPAQGKRQRVQPPFVTEDLHFESVGDGEVQQGFEQLFVVPAAGGEARQISFGARHVGTRLEGRISLYKLDDFSWAPDGRSVYVSGAGGEPENSRVFTGSLYRIDLTDGRWTEVVGKDAAARASWGMPRISPDGSLLAYKGFAVGDMEPKVERQAELWIAKANGSGARRILIEGQEVTAGEIEWASSGQEVLFTASLRGAQNLYAATYDGKVRRITRSEDPHFRFGNLSAGGLIAGVLTGSHRPGDVVTVPAKGGRPRQITRLNQDLLSRVTLGSVDERWSRSRDGTRVQSWLWLPPGGRKTDPLPLIVDIHGGPFDDEMPNFNFEPWWFAAQGYAVLAVSYRGGDGYGRAFAVEGQRGGFPNDLMISDIMAAVDETISAGLVDPNRLFVKGASAGGHITAKLIGLTDRFSAAVAGIPFVNWISQAGTTDAPLYTHNFFDKPFWEDPGPWLDRSAIMSVGKVTTPTMVIVGERDRDTPPTQGEEFYRGLKIAGRAPARLIRLPYGHTIEGDDAATFARTRLHILDWFRRWDKGARSVTR